jgi:hypothetical protein
VGVKGGGEGRGQVAGLVWTFYPPSVLTGRLRPPLGRPGPSGEARWVRWVQGAGRSGPPWPGAHALAGALAGR